MSHITVLSSYHFHYLQMFTCHLSTQKESQPYGQDFWTVLELSKRQEKSFGLYLAHCIKVSYLCSGEVAAYKLHPPPEKLLQRR